MRRAPTRRDVLVAATAALAGCNVLPEKSDPIEASAVAPAVLPESSDYAVVRSAEPTIETTIAVDFSGDVELSAQHDVTATIFQRVYEGPDGRRFGLLTAPAVQVVEQPEVIRDPLTALDDDRVVELALDSPVGAVGGWDEDGSATLLGTETTRMETTATVDGSDQTLAMVRVRAGKDSVTAIAALADDSPPPFADVTRDA